VARPRKFDEQQVVRAARDQFWRTGYAGTSLDDLCAATGLGRGSLYAAFGDKHGLFLRALREYCTTTTEAILAALDGPGSALQRLESAVRAAAAATAADPTSCLLAKATAELAGSDDDVRATTGAALLALHGAIADCVRAAQADRELRADLDADQLAWTVLGVLRGIEAVGHGGVEADAIESIATGAVHLLRAVGVAPSIP
jgi:AcrR family transcriptional regulator